jgi:hypothetical protein
MGCTQTADFPLRTVTLETSAGVNGKLRLLIDTGAELCICKYSSLKEGLVYNSEKTLNVKGISGKVGKTLGEIEITLSIFRHETEQTFHVVGDGMNIPFHGILGKDFFEKEQVKIDYSNKELTIGKKKIKFDEDKQTTKGDTTMSIILKPRSETIVSLPTTAPELFTGKIAKQEIAPGVIIAESLSTVREGTCITSILNARTEEVKIGLPAVQLEGYEEEPTQIHALDTLRISDTGNRIEKLRKTIRVDRLCDRERSSIMRICEHYNDVFHLPGDKLTTTTAGEHAIPTPGIDPCRGIASRNYRIP